MDDKDQAKRHAEELKPDDDRAEDTEGNIFLARPKMPDDPGRENPTGSDASGDDRQGEPGIIPKH